MNYIEVKNLYYTRVRFILNTDKIHTFKNGINLIPDFGMPRVILYQIWYFNSYFRFYSVTNIDLYYAIYLGKKGMLLR